MFRTPALRDRAKYFIYLGIFVPTVTVRMTEEIMGGGGAHEYLMVIFGGLLLSCLLGVIPGLIMEWLMESKATAIVAWATGLAGAASVGASYGALTIVWDNASITPYGFRSSVWELSPCACQPAWVMPCAAPPCRSGPRRARAPNVPDRLAGRRRDRGLVEPVGGAGEADPVARGVLGGAVRPEGQLEGPQLHAGALQAEAGRGRAVTAAGHPGEGSH